MKDADRVRRHLERYGSTTPLDWQPPTADGGKPIMRLAARILDLRREGMVIDTTARSPVATYALRSAAAGLAEDADGQVRLDDAA